MMLLLLLLGQSHGTATMSYGCSEYLFVVVVVVVVVAAGDLRPCNAFVCVLCYKRCVCQCLCVVVAACRKCLNQINAS